MRWVDDGGELLDGEHAEVGDGDAAALQLLLAEPSVPRAAGEIGGGSGNLAER